MHRWIVLLALGLVAAACGGDDSGVGSVDIPEGATFCSVFEGQYRQAIDDAVPITDGRFDETIGEIVAWAEVLSDLAPAEIADEALDNLRYHEAQAQTASAAEFIPGSNAMHAWATDKR